ncbi:MAG: o-succinylbenzoate synthase [Anaerolineae bacterium]|nr:o-succinylbenzoate synthase [Anaerolineae bacterium]NUQ05023.1 o-succinylbenzoate synthase [Anaerolineae bacterium]
MRAIHIKGVTLYEIALPLAETLRTSFGEEPFKTAVLVEVETDEGVTGWGEMSVEIDPGYSSETMGTAIHVGREFMSPRLLGKTISDPTEVREILRPVRGHPLAKHGMETAVWDAFARANDLSIAALFEQHLPAGHASRGYASVGVSIGIKPSVDETIETINKRLGQGYGRIKLKIQPGWDVELARGVRAAHPDILLMLDANSAYTLADADHLKHLDDLNLLMLEQPLGYHDIYEHSKLQPQMKTRICLDESILTADDARMAIELGACRIINLKPGRVGGFSESLDIYRVCVETGTPLWIGGMLETGVGRAAHVAFASLPGVTLPCDISATDRYFTQDISEPPFILGESSRIAVAPGVGTGVAVQADRVEAAARLWKEQYPYKGV